MASYRDPRDEAFLKIFTSKLAERYSTEEVLTIERFCWQEVIRELPLPTEAQYRDVAQDERGH